jgi:hypothetical protein
VQPARPLAARLRRRARGVAADAIHEAWRWAGVVGAVGPDDARGRRFAAMGHGSCIAFPPGAVFGERLISIGESTLIGPNVSLAVGMHPDEPLQVPGGVVIRIGDRCVIGRGVSIIGRCSIEIEDDVTTGPNVYITDHNHSYEDLTSRSAGSGRRRIRSGSAPGAGSAPAWWSCREPRSAGT